MAVVNIAYVCWRDANMTAETLLLSETAYLQNPVMTALCGENVKIYFLVTRY